ncbi:DUF1848 domain-containing protein [Desulfovibrio sp. OttesenSCG-928-C14]|nr:DUF1848 domain-containing protein [Desulfovibrio sp. OttesenSCG-928-C14]
MIISASRRTDIPAFYSGWFMKRIAAGLVLVPNPWNSRQLGQLRLAPEITDCIVFWTKNPEPMLDKLKALDDLGYRYYFSFTLTPYGPDLEKNLPPKSRVLDTFKILADRLGPRRVDWRFDPILLSPEYPIQRHLESFGEMCAQLQGYTERCIINFVKVYPHLAARVRALSDDEVRETARGLAAIAAEYRLPLYNCTEQWDLRAQGIRQSACIDREKIEALTGWPLAARKDPGQPGICHCLESVDIGMYGTCPHGCAYCYATRSAAALRRGLAAHDPESPMLSGRPTGQERISDRTRPLLRDLRPKLL